MKPGDKVRYIGSSDMKYARWGSCDDPRDLLKVGDIFTVTAVEVHHWHTKISIQGCDGKFNSVCFEVVEGKP